MPVDGTGLRPIDLSGTLRLNMGRCIEEPSVCICYGLSCFQLSTLATGRFGYSIRVLFYGTIQMERRPWQLWLLLASTTRRDFAVLTFCGTFSDVMTVTRGKSEVGGDRSIDKRDTLRVSPLPPLRL